MTTDRYRRRIELPPNIDPPKVRAAAEKYLKRTEELRAEESKLHELSSSGLREAKERDAEVAAKAHDAGKEPPGPVEAEKTTAAIAAQEHRVRSLLRALGTATDELEAAIATSQESWQAKVEDRIAERRAAVSAAITELERRHAELSDDLSLSRWLERFPEARFKPAGLREVRGLPRPSGEGMDFGEVIAALLEHVETPKPPEAPANVQPLTQVPRAA